MDALEARDHRDLAALLEALEKFGAVDVENARGAMRIGGDDRQLPALPGARGNAHRLQHDGEQPGGDLLAGGDDGVVFTRVVQGRGLAAPGHELVGLAGHGGDHDGDLVAGIDFTLDVMGDVADVVDVGDRGSAEFHDKTRHADRSTGCERMRGESLMPRRRKARIHTGGVGSPQGSVPAASGRDFLRRLLGHSAGAADSGPNRLRHDDVDRAEVAQFERSPRNWWDERGPMAILHKFNPVRLGYICDQAASHFARDPKQARLPVGAAHPRYRLRRRHPF